MYSKRDRDGLVTPRHRGLVPWEVKGEGLKVCRKQTNRDARSVRPSRNDLCSFRGGFRSLSIPAVEIVSVTAMLVGVSGDEMLWIFGCTVK